MHSAVSVQIRKTKRHIMPMSWYTVLAVTIVHIHADVVQWIGSSKPSHSFTNKTYKIVIYTAQNFCEFSTYVKLDSYSDDIRMESREYYSTHSVLYRLVGRLGFRSKG